MKKSMLLFAFSIGLIMSTDAQELLKINTATSEIKWFGEYTFYFGGHDGTIDFKEGYFIKTNELITGGEFIIDMNSITCNDIKEADANESLVSHLKNKDFFEVENYKTAKLVIKKVTYHDTTHMEIDASLTIKNITLPIRFQAEVDYNKKQMTTKFKIDRQRWGIDYNSKIKDSAISDAIGFNINLAL